jgi:hypothetical protein
VRGYWYFGTNDEYQDVHGRVRSLQMDGVGKVFAHIGEFSADAKRKIIEGKSCFRSAESSQNEKRDANPVPT